MKKLIWLLLVVSGLAFGADRSTIINKEVVWIITDTTCGVISNPDNLPLKEAKVINLKTKEELSGCALDDGTNIEFQMILPDDKHFVDVYFPTKNFIEVAQ